MIEEMTETFKSCSEMKLAILKPSMMSSTTSSSEKASRRACIFHLRLVGSSTDGSETSSSSVLEAGDDVRDLLEPPAAAVTVDRSIVRAPAGLHDTQRSSKRPQSWHWRTTSANEHRIDRTQHLKQFDGRRTRNKTTTTHDHQSKYRPPLHCQ